MTKANKFKAGDKVRCIDATGSCGLINVGDVHTVINICGDMLELENNQWCFNWRFELVEQPEQVVTNKPHPHKDLIIAWASGANIQFSNGGTWEDIEPPSWNVNKKYRIKPEPKPDVVKELFAEVDPLLDLSYKAPNLRLTFCGETGKLKSAEVLN